MACKGWNRVSRRNVCPICEGSDNCSISDDGTAVWCGRIQDGSTNQNAGGQFFHSMRDNHQYHAHRYENSHHRSYLQPSKSVSGSRPDFARIVSAGFSHPDAGNARIKLATLLGVSVVALERLRVGIAESDQQRVWIFPERDAQGDVIGVLRRFENNDKRTWPNSDRGLTFADDWFAADGPLFLVEGPTDTSALLSLGLCSVGRPSNVGGLNLLVNLLLDFPLARDVIVIGENDRKSHEQLKPGVKARHRIDCEGCSVCWPGKFGAESTARQLAEQLQRRIHVMYPPVGSKDVRALLQSLERAA